jgi:hypothetical protein
LIFLTGSSVPKEKTTGRHRTQTALKPSNVLTRSGVNVAASMEQEMERAGMRREGSPPRVGTVGRQQSSISGEAGATRQSRALVCSRARARARTTTHPNQYRIFAMLATSVQFPLLFCPVILSVPTYKMLQHESPLRNQQSLLIPATQNFPYCKLQSSIMLDLWVSRWWLCIRHLKALQEQHAVSIFTAEK